MNIPETLREEVRPMVAAGHKIDAVKRIQEVMDVSMNKAVRVLDAILEGRDTLDVEEGKAGGEPARSIGRGAGSDRVIRAVLGIFFLGGVALLGVGFWLVQKERDFRKTAERVPAVIVESEQTGGKYRPVYEYTWRGAVHRTSGAIEGSMRSRYPLTPGTKETLIISRKDSTRLHVDNFVGNWMWATVAAGAGGVLSFIGIIGWLVTRRG